MINWYCHTLLNLNQTAKVLEVLKNDKFEIVDNFVKAKFFFLTEQIDSSAKYSKLAFQNPNTWKGIIEHTKYYCVYSNWMLNKSEATTGYKSKLDDFYSSLFALDLKHPNESKYIYKLCSLLAQEKYSEFENFTKQKPDFKELYFNAEFNLLSGTSLFQQNKLIESLPFFELAENTPDKRKKTIALRYQLDVYLIKTVSVTKVNNLIERIEDTYFNKLIFRLDDLREKYNLL